MKQTSAPGYLTEAELIDKMEKNGRHNSRKTKPLPSTMNFLYGAFCRSGIGTDASISGHIQTICDRNYVEICAGRTLKPTSLGIALVHGYHKIDPELVLPKVRASIESMCTLIAKGKGQMSAAGAVAIHSLPSVCACLCVPVCVFFQGKRARKPWCSTACRLLGRNLLTL